MADLSQGPFFAVAPLTTGTDAQPIIEALASVPGGRRTSAATARLPADASSEAKETFERLKTTKPVARKELSAALEAVGAGAAQFVLMPTADSRRVVEELLPTLPPELGGGSCKLLTRGFLWAAIGFDAPPTTSLRIVVQSESAGKAQELADFFKASLNLTGQATRHRGNLSWARVDVGRAGAKHHGRSAEFDPR